MLTELLGATDGPAGTLEVVPSGDGHRDVGGEYGQQHQRGIIDGRGRRERDSEICKYANVIW